MSILEEEAKEWNAGRAVDPLFYLKSLQNDIATLLWPTGI